MTVTELNFRELMHAQELFETNTKFHSNPTDGSFTDTRSETNRQTYEQVWCPIKAFCFYLVKSTIKTRMKRFILGPLLKKFFIRVNIVHLIKQNFITL
jgi:hypothetical protein